MRTRWWMPYEAPGRSGRRAIQSVVPWCLAEGTEPCVCGRDRPTGAVLESLEALWGVLS